MLKVTIELFPYGNEKNSREISTFFIANDGTGSADYGNYLFKRTKDAEWEPSLEKWPRALPVEQLVQAVIEKHYGPPL